MTAQETQTALPLRAHTILGVCEAIGEDFGFNPILLRVPFAASVLWSPLAAIGGYFALGAVVLLSRLLSPVPKTDAIALAEEAKPVHSAANSDREEELAA